MGIPVDVAIALLGLIGALSFGIITAANSLRKSARADGQEHGFIGQKLDNMLSLLNDVKRDMEDMRREASDNRERIVRIEAHAEHTDRNVDVLFKKVRHLEECVPHCKEV